MEKTSVKIGHANFDVECCPPEEYTQTRKATIVDTYYCQPTGTDT